MARNRYLNWVTFVLVALLFFSNAWWLYIHLDTAVTLAYMDRQLSEYDSSLSQAQKLLPVAFSATDKASFVDAAKRSLGEEGYEKEGCIWIGSLGLKFDEASELVHIARSWNYGEPGPCFPSNEP